MELQDLFKIVHVFPDRKYELGQKKKKRMKKVEKRKFYTLEDD